ncbi:ABC transporter ATP-binding protein [Solicola gregarius]|uniref:ABC transporter ATP-binding protein/permease n=1 Tax=Solicola gregarius TaxID=2908642 RepID=A0AA46YJR4_9ACTN|nr:ABC transporter ATP-binding protein [Solicola gregarius]UYM03869.1 ABC transporter ATP-binding protein/permease [Solicola gregarius]
MKTLPLADPGTPDLRSSVRYLLWVIRNQGRTLTLAVSMGIAWMVAQALMPAIIGRAIDQGIASDDMSRLTYWAGALLVIGVVQAASGIMRHRASVQMWLDAAYRTVQLTSNKTTELGSTLRKRVTTGEVVSVGANDIANIGNSCDVLGRASGSVVAFFVVAALLLSSSVTLGLIVLIGVPLLLLALGPLLSPLQRRNMYARELQGELNNRGADIVGGLRVLRGIGGEEVFHRRYVTESQRVRDAGVHVGRLQSVLDALQVLLPGIFVVFVVWLGARFAMEGTITPGELVAFYGYATFLMIPLRTATEFANKMIRANVAAGRVIRILSLTPELTDPDRPEEEPPGNSVSDPQSGFVAEEGDLVAIVCDDPASSAALADRLGYYQASDAALDGVALSDLRRQTVRERVMVNTAASTLFSGRLRDELDVSGRRETDEIMRAIHTASAEDVLEALPEGLDAEIDERGRSFSGGQRQRMVLTRALLADPGVLILVEPTSAVDAHTEARIAKRLRKQRVGRTTVVVTASPLLLDEVDTVAFLAEGRVVATGTHRELLESVPAYRRVVTRGEDE